MTARLRVILGVGGGIAAYKSALLLRLFTEAGHDVTVIPTAASLRFVGAATWEALSGHPVHTLWDNVDQVPHVHLGQSADLVVIAPATADLMARAAHGLADDLLTNTLLMATAPVLMAPAMHSEMWRHSATIANVEALRSRGIYVMEPATGRLTGADSGPGRLADPEEIFAAALSLIADAPRDLDGRSVLVSAGGTREPLDPVRFLGNRSSGRQAFAIARAAAARGARVTVVAANVELAPPLGVEVISVETANEMMTAMRKHREDADVVIMAAAVADYRPSEVRQVKIKKSDPDPIITLVKNQDILATLVQERGSDAKPLIVGFAAETGDAGSSALALAREKFGRKRCDLMVFNDVSGAAVFGSPDTSAVILTRDGGEIEVGSVSKDTLAHALLDQVSQRLP